MQMNRCILKKSARSEADFFYFQTVGTVLMAFLWQFIEPVEPSPWYIEPVEPSPWHTYVIYKTHTNLTILLRSLTWQQDRVKHVEQRH
ncbi:hypothetical protein ACIQAA_25200 [Neobacillus sp. NPDC093182]|uniref:hypothetical protein n=1 Tax=Neobacillus sp. NPDC093182 TaxID=3364297 RepID=UPI00382A3996